MGAAKITTDHEEIRAWVEERDGTPAHVKRTGADSDPGILRIDFPGFAGELSLEPMDWDEWFQAFEENGLAFLYQDETADGEESRFNKLISRQSISAGSQAHGSQAKAKSARHPSQRPRG